MEKSRKNLIIQILWIVVIGIIIYFVYNGQNAKKEAEETQQFITCEQESLNKAIEKIKPLRSDPYLSEGDFLTEVQQSLYRDYNTECLKKYNIIKEK